MKRPGFLHRHARSQRSGVRDVRRGSPVVLALVAIFGCGFASAHDVQGVHPMLYVVGSF